MKSVLDAKKQMLANYYAVARIRKIPWTPIYVDVDGVWVLVDGVWDGQMEIVKFGMTLNNSPKSGHTVPREVLVRVGAHATEVRNYRGRIPGTFAGDQWVVYLLSDGRYMLEFDLDEESPVDVIPSILHWARLWWRSFTLGKTDPFRMARVLKKGGIDVEEV